MSKPALGRGLASLLQEETDRGDVKAPGLASWKGAESPVPANPEASTTVPTTASNPASPVASEAMATLVPVTGPEAASMPSPASSEPKPVVETAVPAPKPVATAPSVAPSVPASAPVHSHAGGPAVHPSATPAAPLVPPAATVPGWIIPALIAGDLVVVLSGILWAAWGRGWGRWPWIAALFAVGCSQALAALFLSRAGQSTSSAPFSGRPAGTGSSGPAPGIRVRFVEEQPQTRRGDRR